MIGRIEGLSANSSGHLCIGVLDTVSLALEYGTPLYVMNKEVILNRIASLKECLKEQYEGNGQISYPLKAFCCKEICRIAKDEELHLGVFSGGELYTALSVDFPPSQIYFHGFNKTAEELTQAIEAGVGCIVVDSCRELELIDLIAGLRGKCQNIMLRILPGVTGGIYKDNGIGQADSRFGFALAEGEICRLVEEILRSDSLHLQGLHCHIATQIFEGSSYILVAKMMLNLMDKIHKETGVLLKYLNMGGGFGIQNRSDIQLVKGDTIFCGMLQAIKAHTKKIGYPQPTITIEPGRYLVGESGITLYRIGTTKEMRCVRSYVGIDGGVSDNARYLLYGAYYEGDVANRVTEPKTNLYTIAGKSGLGRDMLGKDLALQKTNVDDILAIYSTGAYTYSLCFPHSRNLKPAVVMVSEGKPKVIIKRQDFQHLIALDQ